MANKITSLPLDSRYQTAAAASGNSLLSTDAKVVVNTETEANKAVSDYQTAVAAGGDTEKAKMDMVEKLGKLHAVELAYARDAGTPDWANLQANPYALTGDMTSIGHALHMVGASMGDLTIQYGGDVAGQNNTDDSSSVSVSKVHTEGGAQGLSESWTPDGAVYRQPLPAAPSMSANAVEIN